MSSNQQALLMAGGGSSTPPVASCIADPYYDCPEGDPYFANVVLLLHGDASYADSSSYNRAPTVSGATISTSTKKYGAGSMSIATGQRTTFASSEAFGLGSGDFTIEFWVSPSSLPGVQTIILGNSLSNPYWFIRSTAANQILFTQDASSGGSSTQSNTALVVGVWQHIAICRVNNIIQLYVNGVRDTLSGPGFTDTTNYTNQILYIGDQPGSGLGAFNGFIDDIRITRGIARYTGNFVVPTAAFPDVYGADTGHTILSLHGESIVDSSSEPKPLVTSGSPTISTAASQFGTSSLLFPASPQSGIYTTQTQDFIFQPTTAFTVEFWINLIAAPVTNTADVVCFGAPGAGVGNAPVRSGWAVGVTPSRQVVVRIGDLGASTYNSATTVGAIDLDSWTHVVISVYGTTAVPSVFLDGVLQSTTQYGAVSWAVVDPREPDTSRLYLGLYDKRAGGSAIATLNSYIDDLRITRGVARELPNTDSPFGDNITDDPDFSSVALLLHFDGSNGGTTFTDSSSYARTISVSNGSPTTVSSPVKFGTAAGEFTGTTDGLSTPHAAELSFGNGAFTIEFWIYLNSNYAFGRPVLYKRTTGFYEYRVVLDGGGSVVMTGTTGASQFFNVQSTAIPLGAWTHVAIAWNGNVGPTGDGVTRIFLNGVNTQTGGAGGTFNTTNPGILEVGYTNQLVNQCNFYLDDLRITKGVARYTAAFTPPGAQAFTPPTLTFCDSETASYSGQTDGTERLVSQQLTTSQGTLTIANPWVKLSGTQLTASPGSVSATLPNKTAALTGTSATVSQGTTQTSNRTVSLIGSTVYVRDNARLYIPPYPDFTRVPTPTSFGITVRAEVLNAGAYIAQARLNLNADGSLSITVTTGTQIAATNYPAVWLYNSFPNGYNIPDVANAYRLLDIKNVLAGAGLVPFRNTKAMNNGTDMAAGGYWEVVFIVPNTSPTTSKTEIITTGPLTINPRYGEFNYYGIFYFTITVVAP
jgi:Concanavalin A-like lectin/glucanases superfamily